MVHTNICYYTSKDGRVLYPPWHQIHIIMKPIWGYGIGDSTIVEEELDDKLGSKTRPNSEVIVKPIEIDGFFIAINFEI